MKISIVRGDQVICSSSDEQMTMEDVNAIKRKERMTDRKSTLSVCVYDPNKETRNPIKIPQDTAKIIEDAKVIAAGGVPGAKTVVVDSMPEEVRKAEEKSEEVDETPIKEDSENEESSDEVPTETSGFVSVGEVETPTDDDFVTTVANTDEETTEESEEEVDEDESEDDAEETPAEGQEPTTEFNVQSKFTQPTENDSVEETTEESEEEVDEDESEDDAEETPAEEIINKPSASSKVIDDFFAKEAREAKMYGNKGKNYKQQRGNRNGKGRRIEEY